jgi:hypothetical protein
LYVREYAERYPKKRKYKYKINRRTGLKLDLFGNLDRKKKAKYNIHEVNGDEQ